MLMPGVVVPSRVMAPMLMYAESRGIDVKGLMAAHGLRVARDATGQLPAAIDVAVQTQAALFDDVANRLGDPLLGIRLGLQMPRGAYGLLEFASHIGPNLQSVIDVVVTTAPLVATVATVSCTIVDDQAEIHHQVRVEGGYGRHVAEMSLAAIYIGGRRAVGESLQLSSCWFSHAAPPDGIVDEVSRLFGCPVRYEADDNGCAFPAALLQLPTRFHDHALHAFLVDQAKKQLALMPETVPFVRQADNVVDALLQQGRAITADAVARGLALSVRTLQRRFAEHGASLTSVVERARERAARTTLSQPGVRIEDAAVAAGFGEVSSFSKAFKRWTGHSPSTFRAQCHAERVHHRTDGVDEARRRPH
jgi:AraC-like DNA-binding protein